MALTQTRPETETQSETEVVDAPTTVDGLLGSADHKTIGRAWLIAGSVFLAVAAVLGAVAGLEAVDLGGFSLLEDGEEFTQVWSFGRELLLFGALVPMMIGLATYLVPLQIGAPAMTFARGAAGAFWTWLLATLLLGAAYLLNGGPGGGQTDFVVLWAVSLGVMIAALLWAMTTIATTILTVRTTGMTLDRVPFTTWSFLLFSLLGLLSLPIVLAELVVIYIQVRHGFLPLGEREGLAALMDGLTVGPVLYWIAVPVLGMAVDAIGVHTGRPVKAHRAVLAAIGVFAVLAYGVDFVGMATLRPIDTNNELLPLIALATILPVLAVLGLAGSSLRSGELRMGTPLLGALVSGLLVLLATVVSLLGQAEAAALALIDLGADIDENSLLVLSNTTFHDGMRGLVSGAALVGLVGALHHWGPKIWGRRLSAPLGLLSILTAAGGAVIWAAGAVLAGEADQAAYPVSTLTGGENVEFFNGIAFLGLALVAVAAVVTTINVLGAALGRPQRGGGERWSGMTLEWGTTSPPPIGNFSAAPVVASATPLADIDESTSADSPEDAE
ncbi:MAG: cbb3-type cytochrome c oxidase subunit I [Actinomycetota bacterium]